MINILEADSKAVNFTLPDEHGSPVTLHDFRGKRVVLYFCSKNNTPRCTKQACVFKVTYEEFEREDIIVIGISRNSSASHVKFKKKYELLFLLLSDTELSIIQAYDAWEKKKLYGKTYMGATRPTYVVDEGGVIIKAFERASSVNNTADILQYVKDIRWTPLYTLL